MFEGCSIDIMNNIVSNIYGFRRFIGSRCGVIMLSRIPTACTYKCACTCTCIISKVICSYNSETVKQPSEGDGERSSHGGRERGGDGGAGSNGQGAGQTDDGVHVSL